MRSIQPVEHLFCLSKHISFSNHLHNIGSSSWMSLECSLIVIFQSMYMAITHTASVRTLEVSEDNLFSSMISPPGRDHYEADSTSSSSITLGTTIWRISLGHWRMTSVYTRWTQLGDEAMACAKVRRNRRLRYLAYKDWLVQLVSLTVQQLCLLLRPLNNYGCYVRWPQNRSLHCSCKYAGLYYILHV